MDTRFAIHNMHLVDAQRFAELDPNLRILAQQTYVYHSPLITELPRNIPGIYTVGGGRQIGKSTLLKQWVMTLIKEDVVPDCIAWFTGELINDHHALVKLFMTQLQSMPADCFKYIVIDEVTYITGWDKAVKYLADAGLLQDVMLVLTGSDLVLIQQARMRFPGRRGKADKVNFHVYPLSFREMLNLTGRLKIANIKLLYQALNEYLIHGGYLTAINQYAKTKKISISILDTYSEWIRGDVIKHGRQEHYLSEIIGAIIKRYNTQISWINLAKDLSIEHHKTISEYIQLLESMDAVFTQYALLEDKLVAAPKKNKKLIFTDPFIYHALLSWLKPVKNPFEMQILKTVSDPILSAQLIETIVVSHFRRIYRTYYIKAEGEIDIAYVSQQKFWPVEVKWTQQLRPKDLKQIRKYDNAVIYGKVNKATSIMNVPVKPLPLALVDIV